MPGSDHIRRRLHIGILHTADLRHVLLIVEGAATSHRCLHTEEILLHLFYHILLLVDVIEFALALPARHELVKVVLRWAAISKHFLSCIINSDCGRVILDRIRIINYDRCKL